MFAVTKFDPDLIGVNFDHLPHSVKSDLTLRGEQLTIKLMPFFKKVHGSWFMVHRFKKETINYEQSTTNRKSKGFTLIELLVVIAIIGILASLATYSYTDSQKKSRDSRRKSDLTTIQKALELAKQDTAGGYSYSACNTAAVSCTIRDDTPTSPDNKTLSVDLVTTGNTYIKAIPVDPKSGAYYIYYPTGPASPCTAGACTGFSLVACLENIKDPQKEYADGNASDKCGGSTADGLVGYVISNL